MINYTDRALYIRDRKAQRISEVMVSPRVIVLKGENSVLDNGVINMADGIYACLHSADIRYICLVTEGDDSTVLTLYMDSLSEFEATVEDIQNTCPSLTISPQNFRVSQYAKSVAEKLREGVRLRIQDAQSDENIVECPECGVANEINPALPFCMECGAALNL